MPFGVSISIPRLGISRLQPGEECAPDQVEGRLHSREVALSSASRDNSAGFKSCVPANYVGGIVPPTLRASLICFTTAPCAWYNSSSKLQCTLFLKLGSHYQRESRSLRSWDNSACASNFARLVFSESHYLYWNVLRKRIMAPMNSTVPMAAIARSCGQTTPIPASLMSTREQNSI